MIITKKNYSSEFYHSFQDSIFAKKGEYDDAIIGVTADRRIVYDFYHLHNLFEREYSCYKHNFVDRDQYLDFIRIRIWSMINILDDDFLEYAPIFISDIHFLYNIYPTLLENQTVVFNQ